MKLCTKPLYIKYASLLSFARNSSTAPFPPPFNPFALHYIKTALP